MVENYLSLDLRKSSNWRSEMWVASRRTLQSTTSLQVGVVRLPWPTEVTPARVPHPVEEVVEGSIGVTASRQEVADLETVRSRIYVRILHSQ